MPGTSPARQRDDAAGESIGAQHSNTSEQGMTSGALGHVAMVISFAHGAVTTTSRTSIALQGRPSASR